jgi:hypothetical protein
MQTPRTDQGLSVSLARTETDVRAAQRLGWRVFVDELGARIESPAPGLDADRFDGTAITFWCARRRAATSSALTACLPGSAWDAPGACTPRANFTCACGCSTNRGC